MLIAILLLIVLGKLSNRLLVSWGRNADIFNKQQFCCCFTDHSLSTLAYWTK